MDYKNDFLYFVVQFLRLYDYLTKCSKKRKIRGKNLRKMQQLGNLAKKC